jgi:AcrR family transcriptional regulator
MAHRMKQRKKQPARTRSAILGAAGTGFSRSGYAGTGLGAIVAEAELTKGALFHHFPDKRSLAVAWVREDLTAAMEEVWIAPLAGMRSLDELCGFSRGRCLEIHAGDAASALVAMAAETGAAEPMIGAALEDLFVAWRAAVAAVLERGKADLWIHRSIRPEVEAGFFVALFAGFTVTTKVSSDENIHRVCADALEAYLETLRAQG